jgi:hypothetical protein
MSNEIKRTDYRVEPGLYQVGELQIMNGGPRHWQLRDEYGDIIEFYPTLKAAFESWYVLNEMLKMKDAVA